MVPAAKELASRLVQKINDGSELTIPPYPAVAAQLQRLPRDTVTLAEVASIIGTDASLTANLLREASSAHFGGIAPTSLEGALGKLGLDMVVRTPAAGPASQRVFFVRPGAVCFAEPGTHEGRNHTDENEPDQPEGDHRRAPSAVVDEHVGAQRGADDGTDAIRAIHGADANAPMAREIAGEHCQQRG